MQCGKTQVPCTHGAPLLLLLLFTELAALGRFGGFVAFNRLRSPELTDLGLPQKTFLEDSDGFVSFNSLRSFESTEESDSPPFDLFLLVNDTIVFNGVNEDHWLQFVANDFSNYSSVELNPWKNDCSKERKNNPSMHTFTQEMVNNLFNNTKLVRKELVEKAGVWTEEECPSTVDYHSHVAAFSLYPEKHKPPLKETYPIMTTAFGIRAVCQLKILERIMQQALNSSMHIIAGSHLGAIRHGGTIPWDDDVDVWIPRKLKDRFLEICGSYNLTGASVHCWTSNNALKLWVEDKSPKAESFKASKWPHHSPYVDIFLYDETLTTLYPSGKNRDRSVVRQPRPIRHWLLSGSIFSGPMRKSVLDRYDLSTCRMSDWNHRFKHATKGHALDCCVLKENFPFSYSTEFSHEGRLLVVEQTVLKNRVLSATVRSSDFSEDVERIYSLSAEGHLQLMEVPALMEYDP